MDKYKTYILESYEDHLNTEKDCLPEGEKLEDYIAEYDKNYLKLTFLSGYIFDIMTYDDELSFEFGKTILEVMKVIKNKENFKYIMNKDNYKNYILCTHLFKNMLTWGTSIRGAWFDFYDGYFEFQQYGKSDEMRKIKISEDFMDWFLDWLSKE